MSDIIMWDDTNVSLIPADATCIAYYVDGAYDNESAVAKRFPKAKRLSIAVSYRDHAEVLDVEPGDASNADVFYWLKAGQKTTVAKLPVIYTSVDNVDSLMLTMTANKFRHGVDFLLWSSHYGDGEHICGPNTCKLTKEPCDGTQFTDKANGLSLDESVVEPTFFKAPVTPVEPPKPTPLPTPAPTPIKPPTPVVAPPKPVSTVTLDINGTKIVLEPNKAYTLEVS